ncbi:MAG: aminodeoxychorismate lyase [endosymbiont of Galathealinum brachiosum]|uniref:Aminodeoxychorismate lyase n=1 Tax=endosymbiont of Galathealinum brachiosum TaxID=2200906 RepID=A0A370DMH4_9GAMM|nr:MAG: aminodeoxychorismate lyase [endosymbiont of Galathealinum brachiosum]
MTNVLINGFEETSIDVRDRGFQYGDGLFETISYTNKKLQFWDEHMQRLRNSCNRLSLACVDESLWLEDIDKLELDDNSVVKLMISRGVSGRGYIYAEGDSVTRVTASFAMPDYPEEHRQGITTTICKTPISINAALAGMKHLNRLDNVLARNEWNDSDITEGFMFDSHDHVIEGTMSNVFCVMGDELYTPLLERCGVEGVMRQQVINIAAELKIPVNIVDISKQNFLQMDAVFVTNSLIGIWPVKKIIDDEDSVDFKQHKMLDDINHKLIQLMSI